MTTETADKAEVDQLRQELAATQAELTKLRDKYQQMLFAEAERDRRRAATARRQVQREIAHLGEHDVRAAVDAALLPLTGLIYRVGQLGDRAGPKIVAELKKAASAADYMLSQRRATPPEVERVEGLRAEITRLRDCVLTAGRRLHDAQRAAGGGVEPGGVGHECSGCQMIISMDAEAVDEQDLGVPRCLKYQA